MQRQERCNNRETNIASVVGERAVNSFKIGETPRIEKRAQGTKIICKSAITRSHQRESAMSGNRGKGDGARHGARNRVVYGCWNCVFFSAKSPGDFCVACAREKRGEKMTSRARRRNKFYRHGSPHRCTNARAGLCRKGRREVEGRVGEFL